MTTKEKIGLVKFIFILITIILIFVLIQPKHPTKIMIDFCNVFKIDYEFQSETIDSDD